MISVYSNWTEEEQDAFYSNEWTGVRDTDWWGEFMCYEFKQEWSFDDLSKALKEDIDAKLSLDEIKVKYLK